MREREKRNERESPEDFPQFSAIIIPDSLIRFLFLKSHVMKEY